MRYKAVLFDMDGVILNSEPIHLAAFRATLRDYGKRLSDKEYKDCFAGRTDETGFQKYFKNSINKIDMSKIMADKAKQYLRLAKNQTVPYPEIVQLIKDLSGKVPLALVTSSLKDETEVSLDTLGIKQYFQVILCAEDINTSKPSPEGYLKAAVALAINPRGCVVIEDAPSGILAARNAGMRCIAVTNTHSPNDLHDANEVVKKLTIEMF